MHHGGANGGSDGWYSWRSASATRTVDHRIKHSHRCRVRSRARTRTQTPIKSQTPTGLTRRGRMAELLTTLTRKFKLEAGRLVRERGGSVAQVSRNVDVGESLLRRWIGEPYLWCSDAPLGQIRFPPTSIPLQRSPRAAVTRAQALTTAETRSSSRKGLRRNSCTPNSAAWT